MFQIQMQFIPGSDQIWVARINQNDTIYEFDNEQDAINKMQELKSQDTSQRQYRIMFV
jgi:hypothetical protein